MSIMYDMYNWYSKMVQLVPENIGATYLMVGSTRWCSWLRQCAKSGFDSQLCHWNFSLTKSGIDSVSDRSENQEYFLGGGGGKGGRRVGLTTLPPSCADCLEIWKSHSPGILLACPGL
jgi:hypothetical protein